MGPYINRATRLKLKCATRPILGAVSDTGFHPAAQAEFSKHLAQYSKNNNVKLFLTTHNVEFIDNFLKSVKELGEEYLEETRIITFRNSGSNITQRTLDGKMALDGRNEFSLELR